jgi:hypothetical protein
MTVKTLLLVQTEVLVVAAIVALFLWRYWWEPQQHKPQLPVPPAAVQAPLAAPAAPVAAVPSPKSSPLVPSPAAAAPLALVKNGDFVKELAGWSGWKDGRSLTNLITVVRHDDQYRTTHVLRLENPDKKIMGVQQPVSLVSGAVYRLSAKARSTATISSDIISGGRVALYLPPQPEHAITWVTENTNWWARTLTFTNAVTGVGALYVHMGYGNVASTGEFAQVALDMVSIGK